MYTYLPSSACASYEDLKEQVEQGLYTHMLALKFSSLNCLDKYRRITIEFLLKGQRILELDPLLSNNMQFVLTLLSLKFLHGQSICTNLSHLQRQQK